MKKLSRINQILSMRKLIKQWGYYTEAEVNVLICIYVMTENVEYCSGKTLFDRLSQFHRTPYKKKFLSTIRKFKQDQLIRTTKKGKISRIHLGIRGYMVLVELEKELLKV